MEELESKLSDDVISKGYAELLEEFDGDAEKTTALMKSIIEKVYPMNKSDVTLFQTKENDLYNEVIEKSKMENRPILESDFEKGRKVPIGTVSNGREKIDEGKWVTVKEDGTTKKKKKGAEEKEDSKKELAGENAEKKDV